MKRRPTWTWGMILVPASSAASLWDGGPDKGALLITADVGDEFIELEKCAVQASKE